MIRKILIYTMFVLITTLLYATNDNLIQSLKSRYLNLNTFEATITQTNWFSEHDISLISKGTLFIEGYTVVIEYTEPTYQFMKTDGRTLTLYTQEQNTAIVTTDENSVMHLILHFSNLLNHDFILLDTIDDESIFQLVMPFEEVHDFRLHVNTANSIINKISYKDDMNNTVSISFENQRFNQRLNREVNTFTIPEGTTIINQ